MTKNQYILQNIFICISSLVCASILSRLFIRLGVPEHITTIYVFVVFVVSLFTKGYIYGIVVSIFAVAAINYAFTYPYRSFDFLTPINLISAIVMLVVSITVGALTTKLKELERARAESEREKMRATLLRAVSHDIRTPLTSIYSASGVLLDEGDRLSSTQKDEMLSHIKSDSEWLVRMVENLLTVTRIDNKTMQINKTAVIVDELVDSAIAKFATRYPDQKVDTVTPQQIVEVCVDPLLIEQVILNLLENACAHARGMTSLQLMVYTKDEQVIFEICDDGCGIDENRIERLLAGYYENQHDSSGGQARFAGIGLSVCSTIIRAHGGTIKAQNSKTGGAVFSFNLKKEGSQNEQV